MQLLDLKTKDLWSGKFTELKSKLEELEVQKCMHIAQHKWTALKEIPQVEALIFGAWNSLPAFYSEVKKLAYIWSADDLRVDIFVRESVLLHEYNKK
ncbi:hypothetical protein AVEN_206537-1 [Araneus ventricosus]|uniref:Uncharacterized protein n=1 Tax=Araneus ventricosus TaxID=182803 RepID=A0A4Y2BSD4_ARAVE|nr:hypothetical protein AVEN_40946-1 [Araneus ventricosus]GBL95160.1 hypothetical protein AVEN_206537-1 [Araneus ventricosus]